MAVTVEQNFYAKEITVSNAFNTLVVSSTNITEPKFKFVFDVYINAVKEIRIRRAPNPSDRGVISLREVLRSFVEPTKYNGAVSIDDPATATFINPNTNTLVTLRIDIFEEYANTANSNPIIQGSALSITNKGVLLGALQYREGLNFDTDTYLMESSAQKGKFLSVAGSVDDKRTIYVTDNDTGVLGILSLDANYTTTQSYGLLHLDYFEADGTALTTNTIDLSTIKTAITTPTEAMQFLQVYPKNLEELYTGNLDPTNGANAGWKYYEIYLENGVGTQVLSEVVRFEKMECRPFENIRLRFLNNVGTWDYLNFQLNHQRSYQVNRNEFKKVLGDYSSQTFSFGQSDRGEAISNTMTMEELRINSDTFPESYNDTFQQLLSSREVYIMQGVEALPVTINDSNKQMIKKIDQQMIRYQFTITYSNEILSA